MRTVRTSAIGTTAIRTAGGSAAPKTPERQHGGALLQSGLQLRVGGVKDGPLGRVDGYAVLLQAREEFPKFLASDARPPLSAEGATAGRTELQRGAVPGCVV